METTHKGEYEPLPTVEEMLQVAAQLSKRVYSDASDKTWLQFEDERGNRQTLTELGDIGEYINALHRIEGAAKFIKNKMVKAQEAGAESSIVEGAIYTITGMRPKYLNGVRVKVVSVAKYALVEILDMTGYKDTKGTQIGVPFACLIPAA